MVGVQGSPFRVTLRDLGPTAMSQYHQIVPLMPSKFRTLESTVQICSGL